MVDLKYKKFRLFINHIICSKHFEKNACYRIDRKSRHLDNAISTTYTYLEITDATKTKGKLLNIYEMKPIG